MIALSLLFATAIWSFGSFVLTCVGTEESRVNGVGLDAIDAAARLAVTGLKVDEVVVVDIPAGSADRRGEGVEASKAACRGDGVAAAFLARRGLALVRQLERRRQVLGELN